VGIIAPRSENTKEQKVLIPSSPGVTTWGVISRGLICRGLYPAFRLDDCTTFVVHDISQKIFAARF